MNAKDSFIHNVHTTIDDSFIHNVHTTIDKFLGLPMLCWFPVPFSFVLTATH